jgi:bifunctional non-homologous end joining protein LigD
MSTSRKRAQLGEYRRKRRFDVTAEPEGKVATRSRARTTPLAFVVQKHRATALHYDFRLEWRGVMRSWAVPKGPSLDPSVKRMAMQVEDHPLAYNQFEGIIPAGEYGGGTVMIWDRGTWTPESEDVDAALDAGELKLTLFGHKLHGSWVLVRLRARPSQKRQAWLLIKRRDEWADTSDVTETEPRSVESKRLLVEIARDERGDIKRAADGDPPSALRRLLDDPTLVIQLPKRSRNKPARSR